MSSRSSRSILVASLACFAASGCAKPPARPPSPVPLAAQPAEFVGGPACAECHEKETKLQLGTDHDHAMEVANEQTVVGDFDDASFEYAGITSTFFRRDGGFYVRTDGPDGAMHEYPIAYTFGLRPLQQYLIGFPDGRYQSLGIAWDTRPADEGGQRWFHLYPDERVDYRDELHWTGALQNWNYMCAECHSTRLRKGYVAGTDRFETTWSEIDVSCEACHGPGSHHVEWARAYEDGDESLRDPSMGLVTSLRVADDHAWVFDEGMPTARRRTPLEENVQVETCGRCHARRSQIAEDYTHGDPLAQTHRVAFLDEGLYHADGQILDEVYVYGSFVQSRMYQEGVTCTDCHDPHGGGLWAEGNTLCAKCHAPAVFDTPEHHFHPEGEPSAQCVECHMPDRNYMVVDPRRDHSMRIPRPDLTVTLGVPNVCNRCHDDQSAEWAADAVREWYGPTRKDEFHYAEAFHAARTGSSGADDLLARAFYDATSPGIVRATALGLLRGEPSPHTLDAIEVAARSEDVLVRRSAAEMLDMLPPEDAARVGAPLLDDPIRTVRIAAVGNLAGVPAVQMSPAFESAVDEFRAVQAFNADRPESHLNLGNLEAQLGRPATAEQAYRAAMTIDPNFLPAYVNLADLLRTRQRDAEAEEVLRSALTRAPSAGAVHHALGLQLVRAGRHQEALRSLADAMRFSPEQPRYGFVYAIAVHDLGSPDDAITILEDVHRRHPRDRDVLAALLDFNAQLGRRAEALRWARVLQAIIGNDPGLARAIESLERGG